MATPQEATPEEPHKFLADSHMSYQQVFDFALLRQVRLLKELADRFGHTEFMEAFTSAALEQAERTGAARALKVESNDLATFAAPMANPDEFWKHTLSYEIVENSAQAFEVKVTECLWATCIRALGLFESEIGYALICHPDYGACRGFNPRLRMERTKTLMQGDDCCNHRWIYE